MTLLFHTHIQHVRFEMHARREKEKRPKKLLIRSRFARSRFDYEIRLILIMCLQRLYNILYY